MFQFIDKIADHIVEKHSDELADLKVLFPNYRAALYLRKRLAMKMQKTYVNPVMLSIDKLVNEYCPWVVPERISLTHILYDTLQRLHKNDESFAAFYNWGNKLLDDFDLIDKHLVDAEKLFKTIDDIHDIENQFAYLEEETRKVLEEFWGKVLDKKQQSDWLNTWKHAGKLYFAFANALKSQNLAYPGMKYRYVAEDLDLLDQWRESPVIVAGFNRLSASEENILKHLKHADFFWDADEYYYKDNSHVAGKYLRKYVSEFGMTNEFSRLEEESEKQIEVVSLSKSHSQSQFAMEYITKQGWEPEKTMLILADEGQLLPLLTIVPDSIENLNISMGWHVHESPIATLIDRILELYLDYDPERKVYPSLDILNLMRHNFMRRISPEGIDAYKAEKEFTSIEDLEKYGQIYEIIFRPLGEKVEIFDRLIALVEELYRAEKQIEKEKDEEGAYLKGSGVFHVEILKYINQKLLRLRDIFGRVAESVDLRELTYLFRQIFRNTRIPFAGEPLSGMQILGPLEARSLDFDNVIIYSMREGFWPPQFRESTIPYSLKKAFDMPVPEDEIAEYSYYFWSLIARTKNVLLLNPSDPSPLNAKAKSRFLVELDLLKDKFENYRIRTVQQELEVQEEEDIIIEKDEMTMQRIHKLEYFSPSSLLDYSQCSLKFYFSRILKLKEPESFDPEYDAAKFGSVFHDTMEALYSSAKDDEKPERLITATVIESLKKQKHRLIREKYKAEYQVEDYQLERGSHLFYIKELEQYVDNILKFDMKRVPFIVLACEKEILRDFVFDEDPGATAKIKGFIDRVDLKDDTYYIIDYKTGSVGYKVMTNNLFSENTLERDRRNILQVLLYAYLMEEYRPIKPQLYGVRDIIKANDIDDPTLYLKKSIHDKNKDQEFTFPIVKNGFAEKIREIYNPAIPFKKTENRNHCKYCAYKFICNRE